MAHPTMTSSTCDLQASLSFNEAKTPVKFLQWIWDLSQCVQSILNSQKWLFSLRKWICAHRSNASNNEGFKLHGASPSFKCEKTYKRALQMPVKMVPMDSERPKTPSWAFTTPHLAKNSPSYACSHFSFFQALLQARHIAPVPNWTWPLSIFAHKTQPPRVSPKMGQSVEQLGELSPESRR